MNSPTVSFGGSLIFKSKPNQGKKKKTKVNDKTIANIISEGWAQRIAEARALIVEELGIEENTIATEELFAAALQDGSLLCKLAQSLSDSRGLKLQIRPSRSAANAEARVVHQNLSRFSRFCRAINLPSESVPSIQDLTSMRLKPLVTCLCDIKRLKENDNFIVYAATWEAFCTPKKSGSGSPFSKSKSGVKSTLKMAIENSITKSEKMKSGGSIMQALRESGQVVPGLFSSSPAAMFHLSARKHLQTSSAIKEEGGAPEFNGDGVTENLLKSLNKVEEKAKLTSDNRVLEDKLEEALMEIETLKALVSQKDQGIEVMKAECKEAVHGIQAKRDELKLATKTVNASVSVLESKEAEINTWTQKYHSAVALHAKEKKEIIETHDLEIQKLKDTLTASEKNVDNLVVELSETKMRESELTKKVKDLSYDVEEHVEQNREHVAALKDLTSQNKKMSNILDSTFQLNKSAMLKTKVRFQGMQNSYGALKDTVRSQLAAIKNDFNGVGRTLIQKCQVADAEKKEVVENYEREIESRRKVFNELQRLRGNIRVLCRVRPLDSESDKGTIKFQDNENMFISPSETGRAKHFEYDTIFRPSSTQEQVYKEVSPMVQSSMDGFHSCIFAYGQTGSGKTYTMQGPKSDPGVYTRSLKELFLIQEQRKSTHNYKICVSMVEIYNEKIRDLLVPPSSLNDGPTLLEIKRGKSGNYLPNANVMQVNSIDDIHRAMARGEENRSVGATKANEHSSRSHCLLIITTDGEEMESGSVMHGRLVLVDLAGSERVGKTDAQGERLREAKNINKSLSALGNVINALSNKQNHVPFRDSKLTYLLQDSLSKDNKVLMIAQISPSCADYQESVCSLDFAGRARGVQLGGAKAKTQNMELPRLQAQLKKAKEQLDTQNDKMKGFVEMRRSIKKMEKENDALQEKLESLEANNQNSNRGMKEINSAMVEKQAACRALEKKLVDSKKQIVSMKEKLHTCESKLSASEKLVGTMKEKVQTCETRLRKADKNVETLEKELAQRSVTTPINSRTKSSTRSSSKKSVSRSATRSAPRSAPKTSNKVTSARKSGKKRKSESPPSDRPTKESKSISGILKASSSQQEATKSTKRVNFNNELSVKELSFDEDSFPLSPSAESNGTREETPAKKKVASILLSGRAQNTVPENEENSMTTRQKELEEWRKRKGRAAPKRKGLMGGATRVKQPTKSSRKPLRTRSTALSSSRNAARSSGRWN
jgi:kinesin family protein C2/C3